MRAGLVHADENANIGVSSGATKRNPAVDITHVQAGLTPENCHFQMEAVFAAMDERPFYDTTSDASRKVESVVRQRVVARHAGSPSLRFARQRRS
jgi:hypothetical protein